MNHWFVVWRYDNLAFVEWVATVMVEKIGKARLIWMWGRRRHRMNLTSSSIRYNIGWLEEQTGIVNKLSIALKKIANQQKPLPNQNSKQTERRHETKELLRKRIKENRWNICKKIKGCLRQYTHPPLQRRSHGRAMKDEDDALLKWGYVSRNKWTNISAIYITIGTTDSGIIANQVHVRRFGFWQHAFSPFFREDCANIGYSSLLCRDIKLRYLWSNLSLENRDANLHFIS